MKWISVCEPVNWIEMAQDKVQMRVFVVKVINLDVL
jgi:hypothetical protein